MAETRAGAPLLEASGIVKSFGAVKALRRGALGRHRHLDGDLAYARRDQPRRDGPGEARPADRRRIGDHLRPFDQPGRAQGHEVRRAGPRANKMHGHV